MSLPGEHEFDTVASRDVYSGAIVALRVDRVAMPGGGSDREVVEHHGAVAWRCSTTSIGWCYPAVPASAGRRLWEWPAGLLDEPGEAPLDAARRELAEETGPLPTTGPSSSTWRSPRVTDESVRVFLATGVHDVERPDAHDEEADLEIARVPLDDAVSMALRGEIVNAYRGVG
ncbi:NUDIX domain-containing protein, partial [Rhodococcus hoagii]|nr:NUDIX domain-containing protein [Prescottella equi]